MKKAVYYRLLQAIKYYKQNMDIDDIGLDFILNKYDLTENIRN